MLLAVTGPGPAAGRAAAKRASPTATTGRYSSGPGHLHPDPAVRAPAKRPGGHGGQRAGCHAARYCRRSGCAAQGARGSSEAADAREVVRSQFVLSPLSHPALTGLHQSAREQPRRPVYPAGCAERRHVSDGGRDKSQVRGDGRLIAKSWNGGLDHSALVR